MKERIIIISVMLLIVFAIQVLAVGFSPSSLTFNLNPGEEDCQIITLSSDSEIIKVSDKWAENKDVEWKVSLFDKDASYHDISIDYDNELLIDEREVEVCLSGNNVGEYHGVLLLTEEQEGSSIIQMGVWLKVIISELLQQTSNLGSSSEGSSGGGGSGGGEGGGGGSNSGGIVSSNSQTNNQNQETTTTQETNEELITEVDEKETNAGITGAVIGEGNGKGEKIIGIILVAIGVLGLFLYGRRKLR